MSGKQLPPSFRWAAHAGVKAPVEFYVRRGHDVDATDSKGRTLLQIAAARGHVDICRLLIEAGADPALRDSEGQNALSTAVKNGREEAVAVLRVCFPPASVSSGVPGDGRPSSIVDIRPPAEAPDTHAGDEEAPDPANWEEVTESLPPMDSPSLLDDARELQDRISKHALTNKDEDWSDIEIDLPRASELHSPDYAAWLDEVRGLIRFGLSNGWVTSDQVSHLVQKFGNEQSPDDTDVHVRVVLGDIGIRIEDDIDALGPVTARGLREDDLRDAGQDLAVEDAIVFLGDLSRNHDPLAPFIKDMTRASLLSREEETKLAVRIENTTRAAVGAIARCPAALFQAVEWADGVEASARTERAAPACNSDEDDGADDGDTQDAHDMRVPSSERSAFLEGIKAMRGLLTRRPAGGTDALAADAFKNTLAALNMTDVGARRLLRTVDAAKLDAEARLMLASALRRREKSRKQFAEANLRLVMWCAKQHGGLPLMDRVQEGNVGLLTAVDRFDHRRGTKFSTFATWWIRQAIWRAVADKGRMIRLPVHMWELVRRIRRVVDGTVNGSGRIPSPQELADELDLPTRTIHAALAVPEDPVMIGVSGFDSVAPDSIGTVAVDFGSHFVLKRTMDQALGCLKKRDADIIRLRFGLGGGPERTLQEVGQSFSLTRERIRQIEATALRRLHRVLARKRVGRETPK